MKKTLLVFLLLSAVSLTYSQSNTQKVIATAGDHFVGTDAQLSWTIGEIMVASEQSELFNYLKQNRKAVDFLIWYIY